MNSSNLINNTCARMQRLVDSLLDISRMESGETELALEPANLPQLIQAQSRRVSPVLQSRGIASRCLCPPYLPRILIDIDKIDRVSINLLDNAIKFTPIGGQISVAAESRGDQVAVSITDTGYGIPPEQRLTSSIVSHAAPADRCARLWPGPDVLQSGRGGA